MLASAQSFGARLADRIACAPIKIRQAASADMEALGRFRYRVYIEQAGKNAEYADHADRLLLEPLDAGSVNLIAHRDDGAIVGAVRISRASDGWQLPEPCHRDPWPWLPASQVACVSRLMVDRDTAPRIATPALFAACFRWGLANSIRLCAVFCAPTLRSLFESYGCQQFDHEFLDQFAGAQVPMVCCLRDRAYLNSMGSPFVNIVEGRAHHRDIEYMRSLQNEQFN